MSRLLAAAVACAFVAAPALAVPPTGASGEATHHKAGHKGHAGKKGLHKHRHKSTGTTGTTKA
jgi:2-methylcitrate dehydratase PrpD